MTVDSGRILVVDDNDDNRDMLSRRLARRGYDVTIAGDGVSALDQLSTGRFDLVLLDVMMPGVDGFEVLSRTRVRHSVAELPVIMATAKDQGEDVVRALELGANDYVVKPLDFAVVLARVRTQLELKRARAALESANTRMRRDLDAGARIQRALIPEAPPALAGVEIAWVFEPCTELGGDILDVLPLDDGRLALYLLDVSGHGVPAALMSVTLGRMLSHMGADSLLLENGDGGPPRAATPAALARMLNRRFPMDPVTHQYFTLAYGVLDPASRALHYVAAGHPGPAHVSAEGAVRMLDGSGLAIGWVPDSEYEQHTIALAPGERVCFYSDGVIEALDPAGELFGPERLAAALSATRHERLHDALAHVMSELRAWCGSAGAGDDVSLLALEIAR
ncbi:MAG TPA: SpoIIE family protein phosphatase [Gemmatimonadales bacterium]|nr:SpoIIE family protein phosphatase [Gemmatimonadales bacterium]